MYARRDGTVRIVNVDTRRSSMPTQAATLLGSPLTDAAIGRFVGKSGRFAEPVVSPDGGWLAIGWPDADQLLFVHFTGRRTTIRAVSNVSSQFRSRSFPAISGWCCAGS